MMNCLWRGQLVNGLDRAGYAAQRYDDNVRVDVGDRKAIEISTWAGRFLFTELTWDETGGLVSETDLTETRNAGELVDIATSLISNY
jgi:hypothetical protein